MPLIHINVRFSDRKVGVQVDSVKSVLEFKEAIQAQLDIPPERQKLIYSGRVLKDDDTVEKCNIQSGQTVHLVQVGQAARQPSEQTGSSSSGTPSAQPVPPQQQIPTNLASGAGAFNPFAGLTGARYAGQVPLPSANMFGPDPGNQVPPSPEQLGEMMQQPAFQQAMSQVLSDPRMVDYLIQSQPQLQAMGPGVRQYMQSEEFRRMMTDPNMFRNMMEMNRMFTQMGMQVPGMPAPRQQSSFPAPGVTNTTQPQHQQPPNRATTPQHPPNPFEAMFPPPPQGQGQGVANAPNPFMALFPTAQPGVQSPFGSPPPPNPFGTPPTTASIPQQPQHGFGTQSPPLNSPQGGLGSPYSGTQQAGQLPFNQTQPPNLQSMWSLLQGLNPGALGQNPLTPGQVPGFLPQGLARPAPDTRPIEERFQEELRQLNDMGFTDFARNIAALRRTGGNVEAAVEMLISGTV